MTIATSESRPCRVDVVVDASVTGRFGPTVARGTMRFGAADRDGSTE